MADRNNPDAEEGIKPSEKKSNFKLFIIIGAAVLLIGGGAVGYFVFSSPKDGGEAKKEAKKEDKKEAKKEGEKKEGEKKEGEKKKPGDAGATDANPNMYHIEPFIVNIFDGPEMRYLKLACALETENPEAHEKLKLEHSKIRDAILTLVTAKSLREIYDTEGKAALRKDIVQEVNKLIAPEKAVQVYFTDFVIQ